MTAVLFQYHGLHGLVPLPIHQGLLSRYLIAASRLPETKELHMLLTLEKVLVLKSVKLFQSIPETFLIELAGMLETTEVAEGEVIIREGEYGQSMYIIVEGAVNVMTKDQVISTLGEREVFGELSALDPEPRSATIVANKPTRLFRVDHSSMKTLVDSDSNVVWGIIGVLCARLRETTKVAQTAQAANLPQAMPSSPPINAPLAPLDQATQPIRATTPQAPPGQATQPIRTTQAQPPPHSFGE